MTDDETKRMKQQLVYESELEHIAEFKPDIVWELYGNPDQDLEVYLHTSVQVLGIAFHMNAIQVDERGNAVDAIHQPELDALSIANDAYREPFQTVQINEKLYVVYLCPGLEILQALGVSTLPKRFGEIYHPQL